MKEIHIGEIIKKRRIELGLTQEELCEGICEPPTMSRIEKGHQTPTRSKLNALLQKLGLPGEKYYAMMSENELEIERLKEEIVYYNARRCYREALEQIEKLILLTDENDSVTQQFVTRSRAISGKFEGENVVPYSVDEQLELLFSAIKITIPNFDIDSIGSHWYSIDKIKILHQIARVYSENNQDRIAIDIYYQIMKFVKKKYFINKDNISTILLIAYGYARSLCRKKRYEYAIEIAEWGMENLINSGRAGTVAGGLLYVLGESKYHTGDIDSSKDYYVKCYYAFLIMGDAENANIMRENIEEHFGTQFAKQYLLHQ